MGLLWAASRLAASSQAPWGLPGFLPEPRLARGTAEACGFPGFQSPADIVAPGYPPPLPWALVSVFALRPSMTLCSPLVPVALRPLRLPIVGAPLLRVFVTARPCGLRQLRFYRPPGLCVLTGLSTRGCSLEPSACPTSLLAWGTPGFLALCSWPAPCPSCARRHNWLLRALLPAVVSTVGPYGGRGPGRGRSPSSCRAAE